MMNPTKASAAPTAGHTLYVPVFDVIRPMMVAAPATATASGTSNSPEFVAETPVTPCKYKGINALAP